MEEILNEKKSALIRDAAIKRFEFTFDLSWKLIRAFLDEKKGIVCASPKDCIKEAYRRGLIEYAELWIDMPDWRNRIVYEYSEEYADDLYKKLPLVLAAFQKLIRAVEGK